MCQPSSHENLDDVSTIPVSWCHGGNPVVKRTGIKSLATVLVHVEPAAAPARNRAATGHGAVGRRLRGAGEPLGGARRPFAAVRAPQRHRLGAEPFVASGVAHGTTGTRA